MDDAALRIEFYRALRLLLRWIAILEIPIGALICLFSLRFAAKANGIHGSAIYEELKKSALDQFWPALVVPMVYLLCALGMRNGASMSGDVIPSMSVGLGASALILFRSVGTDLQRLAERSSPIGSEYRAHLLGMKATTLTLIVASVVSVAWYRVHSDAEPPLLLMALNVSISVAAYGLVWISVAIRTRLSHLMVTSLPPSSSEPPPLAPTLSRPAPPPSSS